MDTPLEIAFHNTEPSQYLEDRIRERVDRMHRRFSRINSCRVVVEVPHRSQANAQAFHVRIESRVPGKELVVSRDPGRHKAHFDPYVMVRDAFDAMERQLEQHSQEVRGDVKSRSAPMQGRVLRTFREHGFIATTDGREIYFHRNAVVDARFENLEEGTPVELCLVHGESPAGPQATTVRPISPLKLNPQPPKDR